MRAPWLVVCGVLASAGCYAEITAGVSRAQGGVQGMGWEMGVSIGAQLGMPAIGRIGAGVDGAIGSHGAQDGSMKSRNLGYQGRAELGTPFVKAAFAYTRSFKDELAFTSDTNQMEYLGKSDVHRFYLGVQREWHLKNFISVGYGIGPTYTYMPNDFVGDTAFYGVQLRASHYFLPMPVWKPSGSMFKSYSGPKPIEQGAPPPEPTQCIDRYGNRRPC